MAEPPFVQQLHDSLINGSIWLCAYYPRNKDIFLRPTPFTNPFPTSSRSIYSRGSISILLFPSRLSLLGSITTFPYSVAVAMSSISNCIPPCYILVVDVVIDAALSASRFPNNKAVHQYDTKVDIVL